MGAGVVSVGSVGGPNSTDGVDPVSQNVESEVSFPRGHAGSWVPDVRPRVVREASLRVGGASVGVLSSHSSALPDEVAVDDSCLAWSTLWFCLPCVPHSLIASVVVHRSLYPMTSQLWVVSDPGSTSIRMFRDRFEPARSFRTRNTTNAPTWR